MVKSKSKKQAGNWAGGGGGGGGGVEGDGGLEKACKSPLRSSYNLEQQNFQRRYGGAFHLDVQAVDLTINRTSICQV